MSTKTSNALSGLQTTSPRTRLNIFHEIFLDLSGFRYEAFRKSSLGAIKCPCLDRKWLKLAESTAKSELRPSESDTSDLSIQFKRRKRGF